jgi:hypothetical protein
MPWPPTAVTTLGPGASYLLKLQHAEYFDFAARAGILRMVHTIEDLNLLEVKRADAVEAGSIHPGIEIATPIQNLTRLNPRRPSQWRNTTTQR